MPDAPTPTPNDASEADTAAQAAVTEGEAAATADEADPLDGGSVLGDAGEKKADEADKPKDDAAEKKDEAKDDAEGAKPAEVKFDVAKLAPPEGFEALDAAALAEAAPVLAELGIDTDEKAQDALNKFAPVLQGMFTRAAEQQREATTGLIVEQRNAWAQESRALFSNDEAMNEEMTHAARFLDQFSPAVGQKDTDGKPLLDDKGKPIMVSPVRQLLTDTGLGNHPDFVKLFVAAGKAIGEGSLHRSDPGAAEKRTSESKFYDPAFGPKS